jgi:REP element-mobilizing transposase RayT
MRARGGLHTFRCQRVLFAFTRAIAKANQRALRRGEYRIVQFSIQGNHVHLLVEADDKGALRSGSQGLAIRFARAFNGVFQRSGKVWAERHDRRAVRSPRHLRNVLVYILQNHRKHLPSKEAAVSLDPCSSAIWFGGFGRAGPELEALARSPIGRVARCVVAPKTWLLADGWRLRGGGPIHPREAPASRRRGRRPRV